MPAQDRYLSARALAAAFEVPNVVWTREWRTQAGHGAAFRAGRDRGDGNGPSRLDIGPGNFIRAIGVCRIVASAPFEEIIDACHDRVSHGLFRIRPSARRQGCSMQYPGILNRSDRHSHICGTRAYFLIFLADYFGKIAARAAAILSEAEMPRRMRFHISGSKFPSRPVRQISG